MPGLTAPSNYAEERPRHPALKINSKCANGFTFPFGNQRRTDPRLGDALGFCFCFRCQAAAEPFNAEPHRSALVVSYITPTDFFCKRNHGPIPKVDDLIRYSITITGLVNKPIQLSMADIWALPKYNVTATLLCAGNRRTAMSKIRKVRGVGWGISALGNATWRGAKLCDVLELAGIPKLSSVSSLGESTLSLSVLTNVKRRKVVLIRHPFH